MERQQIDITQVRRLAADFEADLNSRIAHGYTVRVEATVVSTIVPTVDEFIDKLADAVCAAANISIAQLISKKRRRTYVTARQLYCYLMHLNCPGLTWQAIGKKVNLHHSSVIHSARMAQIHKQVADPYFMDIYTKVQTILYPQPDAANPAPATNL